MEKKIFLPNDVLRVAFHLSCYVVVVGLVGLVGLWFGSFRLSGGKKDEAVEGEASGGDR